MFAKKSKILTIIVIILIIACNSKKTENQIFKTNSSTILYDTNSIIQIDTAYYDKELLKGSNFIFIKDSINYPKSLSKYYTQIVNYLRINNYSANYFLLDTSSITYKIDKVDFYIEGYERVISDIMIKNSDFHSESISFYTKYNLIIDINIKSIVGFSSHIERNY